MNPPLFNEDNDIYVVQKCVIPELHILQGFVNHLFWNGLVPLIGRERALIWPKKLMVIPKNYQGEIFEGNACRKLLKEADKLLDFEVCGGVGRLQLIPFVSAFHAMDKVVSNCFSTRELGPDLDKNLRELQKVIEGLDIEISKTLKIHVLVEHLKHCLHFLGKNGLGLWSEQAGESIHREFLKFWERYKINLLEDSTYPTRLRRAVVEFSSRHI